MLEDKGAVVPAPQADAVLVVGVDGRMMMMIMME